MRRARASEPPMCLYCLYCLYLHYLDEPERDEVAPVARRDVRERRLELAERHLGIAGESRQAGDDNSDDDA